MTLKHYITSLGLKFLVDVAHCPEQGLQGQATMSEPPLDASNSYANKAVDGNTNQSYSGHSCAITKSNGDVWLRVHLGRRFNIAYMVVYFQTESMFILSATYG